MADVLGRTQGQIDAGLVRFPVSLDHFDGLSDREARVQRAPHVSQSLSITGVEAVDVSGEAFYVAADVALTRGGVHDLHIDVSRQCEEALDVHVHVLADGAWASIPSAHMLDQRHRERVD